MGLQVMVTVEDVVKRAKGGTLVLKLKVFAEGANPDVDDPLFEGTASADIKANIEGQTRQQLINRATREAGEDLKAAALTYVRIEEYKNMVNTDAVATGIEKALGGA